MTSRSDRAPFTYVNDRFAATVAALEAYSTLQSKLGERKISQETLKERLTYVKSALKGRTQGPN